MARDQVQNFSPARYALCILMSLIVVVSILGWRTNGFTDYTYETARRTGVEETPVHLTSWRLQTVSGSHVDLAAFGEDLLFVDFIYTRCPTICRSLGSRYQQLQALIESSGSDDVTLLSVSIDPEYDTPDRLALYRETHKGRAGTWKLARPADRQVLDAIVSETGLRVIPDALGGYSHSDSIHVIQDGALKLIEDWDSTNLETLIRGASRS